MVWFLLGLIGGEIMEVLKNSYCGYRANAYSTGVVGEG
jgi:hypothetical protein